MTTGDDLRKIGTGPSSGPGPDDGRTRPVLEADRLRAHLAGDRSPASREVHTLDRVNRLRAIVLSGAGGVLGLVVGMFAAISFPGAPLAAFYPFLAAGALWAVVYVCVAAVTGGAGGLAGRIYSPGGWSGRAREYSLAESLVARGRYEDAVSAFELAVAEHPDDPVPYLRIARISRDHLDDPRTAVRWFRRARDETPLGPARWRLVTRELVELLERTGEPARAAPELARLAELHADTPEGRWASLALADLKKAMAEERRDPGSRDQPDS